jgi:uncharacterized protein
MRLFMFLTMVLLGGLLPVSAAEPRPLERLKITSGNGDHAFKVEVVRQETDRNRGLMFRRKLAKDHGMLFDYDPPQLVGFWMKNTYIPLDIIFIGADGRIIRIAANTTPHSLEHIPSGGPTRGVLEINGGLSAKLGIKAGDRVAHPLFGAVPLTDKGEKPRSGD